MIFDGWIGGIIDLHNPILTHCADEKLETAYRLGLKSFLGLPISTPNSIVYAASHRRPLYDQRHARSFQEAGRLFCFPQTNPLGRDLKKADPDYN
jgi:hypothetical protein